MRGRPYNPADWYAFARRDFEKAKKDLLAGVSLYAVLLLQQAVEKLLKGKFVVLGAPWNRLGTAISKRLLLGHCDG